MKVDLEASLNEIEIQKQENHGLSCELSSKNNELEKVKSERQEASLEIIRREESIEGKQSVISAFGAADVEERKQAERSGR